MAFIFMYLFIYIKECIKLEGKTPKTRQYTYYELIRKFSCEVRKFIHIFKDKISRNMKRNLLICPFITIVT